MIITYVFYAAVSALAALGAVWLGERWPADQAPR